MGFKLSVSTISEILLLMLIFLTLVSGFAADNIYFEKLIIIIGAGPSGIIWILVLAALIYNIFYHKN
jgi:hypothetical protein